VFVQRDRGLTLSADKLETDNHSFEVGEKCSN